MMKKMMSALRGTDWEMLTGFISPAFFDVVPTVGMARVFARIVKDSVQTTAFERTLELSREGLPPVLPGRGPMQARRGRLVLQLYFRQIHRQEAAALDLRAGAFRFEGRSVQWNPKPLHFRWDPAFLEAVRAMYLGFYREDDETYRRGLAALDLEHAADIFRSQFGAGGQRAVRFQLNDFKRSFQAVFESCKAHRTRLHPDFFALGAYLLCLYEHLEALGVPLDVRQAFEDAVEG